MSIRAAIARTLMAVVAMAVIGAVRAEDPKLRKKTAKTPPAAKTAIRQDRNPKIVAPVDSRSRNSSKVVGEDGMRAQGKSSKGIVNSRSGSQMSKEGGDKEPKGGKDKLGGSAFSKEGGDIDKGGKGKLGVGREMGMMKDGEMGKGGKDKMEGVKEMEGGLGH